ncbi:hypothetical protein HanIR_Chr13g0633451 [Helianthus annuus]|nr:hypothetical protein HanIR_Chr13g0633451 [Helianthus annuus]
MTNGSRVEIQESNTTADNSSTRRNSLAILLNRWYCRIVLFFSDLTLWMSKMSMLEVGEG